VARLDRREHRPTRGQRRRAARGARERARGRARRARGTGATGVRGRAGGGARAEPRDADAVLSPPTSPSRRTRPRQWLRRVLPDTFGKLTNAEAAALAELDLRDARIRDEDLRYLAGFPSLRTLILRGTSITDAGIAYLGSLPLESLDLRSTAVSGRSLAQLPASSLVALHLTDTEVTGADLARLPPMPRLATLKLNSLPVDDAALESLAIYPMLRHVELDRTSLTDGGLRRLLQLHPQLTRIEARGTQVTRDAVGELRSLYPDCEIVFEDEDPRLRGR
jgi:ribosomal protein L15